MNPAIILPAPQSWSTHKCPHCEQPLAVEQVGPDVKLWCPHSQCNSVACNIGNASPAPSQAQAYVQLERLYELELIAGAEV